MQLVFDWTLLVSWGERESMLFVGCSTQLCSSERFIEIVKSVSSIMDVAYGFGGLSTRKAGAPFNAVGVGTGKMRNEAERNELIRWRNEVGGPRRFERGLLRDAFPMNILSDAHLGQVIDGQTLLGSIQQGDLPGQLHPMSHGAALWTLSDEEIEVARAKLAQADLILT